MKIRDRIKEFRRVPASELLPNPKNWRTHPQAQQDALRGVLVEIGFADALLARETPAGLVLIDGHLRADVACDAILPVLVLDVDESEADKLLASLDPLAAMAEADEAKLDALLESIDAETDALKELLSDLHSEAKGDVELKQIDTKQPPKMSWCLIGIPTVRFGEVTAAIENLAAIDGVICETTANDG